MDNLTENAMNPSQIALSTLAPGFTDPVHDTQAVFRTLLDALMPRHALPKLKRAQKEGAGLPAARCNAGRDMIMGKEMKGLSCVRG